MAKALPRCRPFGHLHHHKPHRPLIVEFGKGMTGGRSQGGPGGSRRVGRFRSGPAAPCEPVDEGRGGPRLHAAIGKRGVTRTHADVAPSAIVPTIIGAPRP
jgi:hypothetical protein